MTIRSSMVGVTVVGLLVSGIALSSALNLWRTESSKVPAVIRTGDFAGRPDPGDIRGSYTFSDIEAAFGVSPAMLDEAFPADPGSKVRPADRNVKDIEGAGADGIGTDSVRLFVAIAIGLPYEADAATMLPESAVRLLENTRELPPELVSELSSRIVVAAGGSTPASGAVPQPTGGVEPAAPSPISAAAFSLTGKSTFAEILDLGVAQTDIEAVLGMPIGLRTGVIRDYCASRRCDPVPRLVGPGSRSR